MSNLTTHVARSARPAALLARRKASPCPATRTARPCQTLRSIRRAPLSRPAGAPEDIRNALATVTTFLTGSRASLRSAEPSASRVLAALRAAPPAGSTWSTQRSVLVSELGPSLAAGDGDPITENLHAATRHQGRFASLRDGLRPPLTPGCRRATWLVIGSPPSPWPGTNAGTNAC